MNRSENQTCKLWLVCGNIPLSVDLDHAVWCSAIECPRAGHVIDWVLDAVYAGIHDVVKLYRL